MFILTHPVNWLALWEETGAPGENPRLSACLYDPAWTGRDGTFSSRLDGILAYSSVYMDKIHCRDEAI
jgi:hypothetical protein